MLLDKDLRLTLTKIHTVLGRISTTARSPQFEALVDIVELALWEPAGNHWQARSRNRKNPAKRGFLNSLGADLGPRNNCWQH